MKQQTMQSKIKGTINSAKTIDGLKNDIEQFKNGETGGKRIQAAASAVAKIIGASGF